MVDGKKETTLGLGERLRSARKARALTLEQAAFTLRLEESVLRALEDERYAVLGAAVFVRGHLKAYAKLLGLSEEVVLSAYRSSDPSADAPPRVTRDLEKPLTTTPGPVAVLTAVAAAILAMLLLYMLGTGKDPMPPVTETLPGTGAPPTIELVPVLPPPSPSPSAPTPDAISSGDGMAVPPQTAPLPGPEAAAAPAAAGGEAPPAATFE